MEANANVNDQNHNRHRLQQSNRIKASRGRFVRETSGKREPFYHFTTMTKLGQHEKKKK